MFQVVEWSRGRIVNHVDTFRSLVDAQVYCSMRNSQDRPCGLEFRVFNPGLKCFE